MERAGEINVYVLRHPPFGATRERKFSEPSVVQTTARYAQRRLEFSE